MTPDASGLSDEIWAKLRQEFLVDAQERLDLLARTIEGARRGEADGGEAVMVLRREAHNLKGMGGSFGFPTVSLVAHRLEDYLAEVSELHERHLSELQVFLDRLEDLVSLGEEPGEAETSRLVRSLPAGLGPGLGEVEPRDVEVLLTSPSITVTQAVADELRGRGYRVSIARTPWEAFELTITGRPDLLLTSVVLDRVSGVDLARALSTMEATEDLPIAVLTSFPADHPELRGLPAKVAIIRVDQSLPENLAAFLTDFESGRRR